MPPVICVKFYIPLYKQKYIFIKCNYAFSWSINGLMYVETFLL